MKVYFRRLHPDAAIPAYRTEGSAGCDLVSVAGVELFLGRVTLVPCGFSMEFPRFLEAQVRSRSGLALQGIFVANAPGTIDSDYRGEVCVLLTTNQAHAYLPPGSRIAQLLFSPTLRGDFVEVENLSPSERGTSGFGSTGQ